MIRGKEILPPPTITRTGQKPPPPKPKPKTFSSANSASPSLSPAPSQAPPLPVRKASFQQLPPALPPRTPSESSIRTSSESIISGISNGTRSTSPERLAGPPSPPTRGQKNINPMRAPPLDQAKLPPIVPWKKSDSNKRNLGSKQAQTRVSSLTKRDVSNNTNDSDSKQNVESKQAEPRVSTPSKWENNNSSNNNVSVASLRKLIDEKKSTSSSAPPPPPSAPRLPPRTNSTSTINEEQKGQRLMPQLPPRLPERRSVSPNPPETESNPVRQRKLPPPPPRGAALNKLKSSSFATLKHSVADEKANNDSNNDTENSGFKRALSKAEPLRKSVQDAPPPIPLTSRPKLSDAQLASKPKLPSPSNSYSNNNHINNHTNATTNTPADVCLKCRDFSGPDTHAARYPRQTLPSHDLKWLSAELVAPFSSLTDRARAIFCWLHHNVEYDVVGFRSGNMQSPDPSVTMKRGLAVCAGYASLFETLATHAALEVKLVSGYGKGFGYAPIEQGAPIPAYDSNHAWNAVRIDNGEWKLIDSCWGAGHTSCDNSPYIKSFSPKWFNMSNEDFSLTHFPTDRANIYSSHPVIANMSWEDYISARIVTQFNQSIEPAVVFGNGEKDHGIGPNTMTPSAKAISINQNAGRPILFRFGLICRHYSISKHLGHSAPVLFVLGTQGLDGRETKYIPFNHVRGTSAGGGGDYWYLEVSDARLLGTAGQRLMIYEMTKFGNRTEMRGLTAREFNEGMGRVGYSCSAVAEWSLV